MIWRNLAILAIFHDGEVKDFCFNNEVAAKW